SEKATEQHRQSGRLKYADVILEMQKVNSKFAAYTGVDLREQGCRDQDEVDSPFVSRGAKSAHISQYPAADYDEHGMAVERLAGHLFPNLFARLKALVLFPGWHLDEVVFRQVLADERIAVAGGMAVGQHAYLTVVAVSEKTGNFNARVGCKYNIVVHSSIRRRKLGNKGVGIIVFRQ